MKDILTGMFAEQNKKRLLPEDICSAVKTLQNAPENKAKELFDFPLKSPALTSFLQPFWASLEPIGFTSEKSGKV